MKMMTRIMEKEAVGFSGNLSGGYFVAGRWLRLRFLAIFFLFWLPCLVAPGLYAQISETVLFEEGGDGYKLYRIPGIVVTSHGTVLAYCEARKHTEADRGEIEIHLRRSTDGGESWSPAMQVAHHGPRLFRNPHMSEKKKSKNMGGPDEQTVNNPVAVVDRMGAVHLLYCVEYMRCFVIRSDDDGLTWSPPTEITAAFEAFRDRLQWQVIATGPGHGIQLDTGRLVVPFWMTDYERRGNLSHAVGVIYSDDHGGSWQAGEIAVPRGGEPNIVQLADGRVMVTSRNGDSRNRRMFSISDDGVNDWSTPDFFEEILEPGCMAGLISVPGVDGGSTPWLLYSAPYTIDRAHQGRRDVTIYVSMDDGKTWPVRKRLHEGPSAYSDLAVLPDGRILCFYEKGVENRYGGRGRPWAYRYLAVARFDREWLMKGQAE
jgi:sialidase-1